ncbi:MAG: alpha/beta hydrolase [Planctomycetota bacterium]
MDKFLDAHPDDLRWEHSMGNGVDQIQLHFVRQGKGNPILLLHGWPGFWYDWRRIIPRLAENFDVIAPDFRGFSLSDKPDLPPDQGYTLQIFMEDILALLEHLKIPSIQIVAHDIGALVAQKLAHAHPEKVQRLILLNPPYGGIGNRWNEASLQKEFWFLHFHRLPWSDQLISYDWVTTHLYLSHFYKYWLAQKQNLRSKEFEWIVEIFCRTGMFRTSIGLHRAQAEKSFVENIPLISQATTILWGKATPILPFQWSDRLSEYFSKFKLYPLEGVGHFVPLEAPEEIIRAVFQNFSQS